MARAKKPPSIPLEAVYILGLHIETGVALVGASCSLEYKDQAGAIHRLSVSLEEAARYANWLVEIKAKLPIKVH